MGLSSGVSEHYEQERPALAVSYRSSLRFFGLEESSSSSNFPRLHKMAPSESMIYGLSSLSGSVLALSDHSDIELFKTAGSRKGCPQARLSIPGARSLHDSAYLPRHSLLATAGSGYVDGQPGYRIGFFSIQSDDLSKSELRHVVEVRNRGYSNFVSSVRHDPFTWPNRVLVASSDRTVRIVDATTTSEVGMLDNRGDFYNNDALYSPNGDQIVVAAGWTLMFWDSRTMVRFRAQQMKRNDLSHWGNLSAKRLLWSNDKPNSIYGVADEWVFEIDVRKPESVAAWMNSSAQTQITSLRGSHGTLTKCLAQDLISLPSQRFVSLCNARVHIEVGEDETPVVGPYVGICRLWTYQNKLVHEWKIDEPGEKYRQMDTWRLCFLPSGEFPMSSEDQMRVAEAVEERIAYLLSRFSLCVLELVIGEERKRMTVGVVSWLVLD